MTSLPLIASLALGCASHEIWRAPDARCGPPSSGWLVAPTELRWRPSLIFGVVHRDTVGDLRRTLPRHAHHYLRHGRGYAVDLVDIDPDLARDLQHWAWSAERGASLPGELRKALADETGQIPGDGTLLLVQGAFHPRSRLWYWVAAATLFIFPVLTVGNDHEMRLDIYALRDGAHLWRTHHGQDAFLYPYTPVHITWDLLHALPRAGEACAGYCQKLWIGGL